MKRLIIRSILSLVVCASFNASRPSDQGRQQPTSSQELLQQMAASSSSSAVQPELTSQQEMEGAQRGVEIMTTVGGHGLIPDLQNIVYQYLQDWQLSTEGAAQVVLYLDSPGTGTGAAAIDATVVGRATGANQIIGNTLIQTTVINSILSLRSSSNTALTFPIIAGGNKNVSATLTIMKII